MTSGFTNSRDGRPKSCRLVVSVVNHSSVGLAEWWADLQNLHPRIFLNFNPCANFQTLDISYNMCSLFTVRLQVRVWQRWVERCGVSGHVICLSGFYATKVVGDSWVRDYGWERQRGSKWGHYIQTDCAVPGLTAEARRLTAIAIAIMWWSWRGEWSRRELRVITAVLLSVATCNTINDRRLLRSTSRGLAALQVRLLSGIHSAQAWLFISLVLHGKCGLDPRTVHFRKN